MAENGRAKRGDEALLLALAGGATVRDAARSAGIGERTATRRLADPGFRRRVAENRADMVARALGKLADGATEAVDTLRKLLGAEADTVKLGAARSILELGTKLREAVELEERLAELERRIGEGNTT
jgi:HEAT repeat protein